VISVKFCNVRIESNHVSSWSLRGDEQEFG
jgi:hypothetical protein